MVRSCLVVSLLVSAAAPLHAVQQHNALNPLRKVVTLLQDMQDKVTKEGSRELELYNKFMCYCKSGAGDLSSSIGGAETKISSVSSDISEAEAKLALSKAKLKEAQEERTAAFEAIAQAKAIRANSAAAFAKLKSDLDTNTAACDKAISALSSGVAGSFLQTPAAFALKQAVSKRDMSESDQSMITAFLSGSSEYAPQSGQIIGILKEMRDEMSADLAGAVATEEADIASHTSFVGAKKKEIAALTNTVEAKTQLVGDLGVSIARMKHDLTDTQEALAGDKQFLAELDKSCATKTAEWEERSKTRSAELATLAETIKVLNDDDALELFKSTLPGASMSFVQVQAGVATRRKQALAMIREAQHQASSHDKPGLELLALAFAGAHSGNGFGKIISMIDSMVNTLKQEQTDDDHKKEYCALQLDSSDDKKKALERTIAGEENAMATATEAIAALAGEIAALESGISALDTSVAAATAQRKAENAEYKDLIASNTAAKQLLQFAVNRLNQFYNPKLYKAPTKTELSSEDRIYSNMGNPDGILTTVAPGGIAGTGAQGSDGIYRISLFSLGSRAKMGKFLKPGRVVILTTGRHAGKKAVCVKTFDDGSKARAFSHCLVAGVEKAPLKVTKDMGKKKREKRLRVKPFVKYVNYTHVMPTRYSIPADMEPKALVSDAQMDNPDGRIEAKKALSGLFKEKFINPSSTADKGGSGKSALLFLKKKLRF